MKGLRLTDRGTQRTNCRVVSEELPYFYKWQNKTKTLFRGPKPKYIQKNKIITKKEQRHHEFVESYENPIEKALEYQRMIREENLNQIQLARKLGISRVRVWQLLNLLKLSEDQQKYVLEYGKEKMITEQSLRNQ